MSVLLNRRGSPGRVRRRNQWTNPVASADLTGVTAVSASTYERVSGLSGGLPPGVSTGFHAINSAGAGRITASLAVVAGAIYTFSAYVRRDNNPGGTGPNLRITDPDAVTVYNSPLLAAVGGDFTRLSVTFTAVATGTGIFTARGNFTGQEFHATAFLLEVGSTLRPFFLPGVDADAEFEGAAHNSISRRPK